MIKIIINNSLIVLLEIIFCVPAFAQSYGYVNVFNNRHVITIQETPAFVASGDRAGDSKFCKPSDLFYCVASQWLNFAVPILKKNKLSKWEVDGYNYQLTDQGRKHLLGRDMDVLVIESTQDARRFRFLYSERYGLVAFSVDIDGTSETFISDRATGFGKQH